MSEETKTAVRMIAFEDRNGKVIHIPSNLTIAGLVKMGVTDIRIVPPGTPLKEDEFRDLAESVSCPNCSILHAPIDGNFYCPTCASLRKDLGLENHIDEEGNQTRR